MYLYIYSKKKKKCEKKIIDNINLEYFFFSLYAWGYRVVIVYSRYCTEFSK